MSKIKICQLYEYNRKGIRYSRFVSNDYAECNILNLTFIQTVIIKYIYQSPKFYLSKYKTKHMFSNISFLAKVKQGLL